VLDQSRNHARNPSRKRFSFRFSCSFVLGVLIIVSGASGAVAASGSTRAAAAVVPFTSMPEGQIIVPLYIDGAGPLRFLVDTGSSRSAIGEAEAARLALPLVAQTELVTATGSEMRPVARLTNLTVGRARAQALLAPTLSDASVRRLGPGVVGVLGQDFLSRFNYTIDYRHNRLVWHDEEPVGDEADRNVDQRDQGQDHSERQNQDQGQVQGQGQGQGQRQESRLVRLALRESEGRFLIDLPQNAGERAPARFVPDSAADGLVLFNRPGTNQLLSDTAAERGQLVTLGGARAGRLVVLKRLLIGAAAVWNQPAIVLIDDADGNPGAPEAPEGDGLLPLSLFASVTFNNRDGYLLVEPR